jgi:hypothetical protein
MRTAILKLGLMGIVLGLSACASHEEIRAADARVRRLSATPEPRQTILTFARGRVRPRLVRPWLVSLIVSRQEPFGRLVGCCWWMTSDG